MRQGCSLSPYLFLLCVEVLAIKLRADTIFKGYPIGTDSVKLSLYADDTTIFLDGSERSLKRVIDDVFWWNFWSES